MEGHAEEQRIQQLGSAVQGGHQRGRHRDHARQADAWKQVEQALEQAGGRHVRNGLGRQGMGHGESL
ncbi:hypothetical protein D3C81_2091690 [compost metagenome]